VQLGYTETRARSIIDQEAQRQGVSPRGEPRSSLHSMAVCPRRDAPVQERMRPEIYIRIQDAGGTVREKPAYICIVSHMLSGCFVGAC
jgi:hypothetical protein